MSEAPRVISGIEAMRGVGQRRAKGFWADVWDRVMRRRAAVIALAWIAMVAAGAVLAPLLANAHPLRMEKLGPGGEVTAVTWPLWEHLRATDLLLLLGVVFAAAWLLPGRLAGLPRGTRLAMLAIAFVQATFTVLVVSVVHDWLDAMQRLSLIHI